MPPASLENVDPPVKNDDPYGNLLSPEELGEELPISDEPPPVPAGDEDDDDLTDLFGDEDPPKEEPKKDIRIPKERFDQAVRKERERIAALQAELDAVRQGQVRQQTTENVAAARAKIADLQDAYEEALLEGDRTAAKQARLELEELRENLYRYEAQSAAHEARSAAVQDVEFREAVTEIETLYPVLNPDHADYDDEVSSKVIRLMNGLQATGTSKTNAMIEAVGLILGAPAAEPAPEPTVDVRKELAKAARTKAISAAKAQPPSTTKAGLDNSPGSVDIKTLTPERFDRLSEEEKARLRGDYL